MPRHRGRKKKPIKIPGTWESLCSRVRQGQAESNLQQLVRLFNTLVHHIARPSQPTTSPSPHAPHHSGFRSERVKRKNLQRFCKQQPLSLAPIQMLRAWVKMGKTIKCLTLFRKGKHIFPLPHWRGHYQRPFSRGPVAIFTFLFV